MNNLPLEVDSLVQEFIRDWHKAFEMNEPAIIEDRLHEEVRFFSPALYKPKKGKKEVSSLLALAYETLRNYRVTDTWIKGHEVIFEFSAEVDGGAFTVQGVDRLTLDHQGKIIELKVWIRPFTGLKAVSQSILQKILRDYSVAQKFLFWIQVKWNQLKELLGFARL